MVHNWNSAGSYFYLATTTKMAVVLPYHAQSRLGRMLNYVLQRKRTWDAIVGRVDEGYSRELVYGPFESKEAAMLAAELML